MLNRAQQSPFGLGQGTLPGGRPANPNRQGSGTGGPTSPGSMRGAYPMGAAAAALSPQSGEPYRRLDCALPAGPCTGEDSPFASESSSSSTSRSRVLCQPTFRLLTGDRTFVPQPEQLCLQGSARRRSTLQTFPLSAQRRRPVLGQDPPPPPACSRATRPRQGRPLSQQRSTELQAQHQAHQGPARPGVTSLPTTSPFSVVQALSVVQASNSLRRHSSNKAACRTLHREGDSATWQDFRPASTASRSRQRQQQQRPDGQWQVRAVRSKQVRWQRCRRSSNIGRTFSAA